MFGDAGRLMGRQEERQVMDGTLFGFFDLSSLEVTFPAFSVPNGLACVSSLMGCGFVKTGVGRLCMSRSCVDAAFQQLLCTKQRFSPIQITYVFPTLLVACIVRFQPIDLKCHFIDAGADVKRRDDRGITAPGLIKCARRGT